MQPRDDRGGPATSEAANTAARQPLLAPTWTKCWIEKDTSTTDVASQRHAVKCRYDVPDAKQPIKPRTILVDVRFGPHGAGASKELAARSGEDVLIMAVPADVFPIEIGTVVQSPTFTSVGIGQDWFELKTKIESLDAIAAERPLGVKQPFDLWPVVVIPKAFLAYLQLEERAVSVAPFTVGPGGTSTEMSTRGKILALSRDPRPSLGYFVAPKEGELKGAYKTSPGLGTSPTEIPGAGRIPAPGVYVATETELRRATDEEAAITIPSVPSSADDAGASDAAAIDANASDAGTTGDAADSGADG